MGDLGHIILDHVKGEQTWTLLQKLLDLVQLPEPIILQIQKHQLLRNLELQFTYIVGAG